MLLEVICKCGLAFWVHTKVKIIKYIRLSRHQVDSARCTERRRVAVLESNSVCCECIQTRSCVLTAPVRTKALKSYVITKNQDNIWLFGCLKLLRNKKNKKSCKAKKIFHKNSVWRNAGLVSTVGSEPKFFKLNGLEDKVSSGRLVQDSKRAVIYHNE